MSTGDRAETDGCELARGGGTDGRGPGGLIRRRGRPTFEPIHSCDCCASHNALLLLLLFPPLYVVSIVPPSSLPTATPCRVAWRLKPSAPESGIWSHPSFIRLRVGPRPCPSFLSTRKILAWSLSSGSCRESTSFMPTHMLSLPRQRTFPSSRNDPSKVYG